MNRSTVSRIAPIIAAVRNLDVKRNRDKILAEIHKGEHLLYSSLGDETREAFFKGSGCVPVVEFRQDCRSRCRSKYFGFSLPAEVERAEVFRIDGERVPLQSRHSGPAGEWSCRPRRCTEAMDLGSGWSLPVDPCLPCHLGFKLRADGEKAGPVSVGITYFDVNGTMQREDVEVKADEITLTRFPVSVIAMQGITIIGDRCHYLEVWEDTETLVTEIHPSIDVPDFHRYALSGQVCATTVEFEDGQFQPLRQRFDSDSVVTGDPNLWENLIQWRDLHFQTKRTPSEERAYASSGQFLVQQAQQALKLRESDSEQITIEPHIPYRNASMAFRDLGRRHMPVRFPRRR